MICSSPPFPSTHLDLVLGVELHQLHIHSLLLLLLLLLLLGRSSTRGSSRSTSSGSGHHRSGDHIRQAETLLYVTANPNPYLHHLQELTHLDEIESQHFIDKLPMRGNRNEPP